MAKTRTRRPTNSPVTEFPAPPGDSEAQDASVETQDQPEPEQPPAPAPRKDPLPRIREFFSGLQDISAADWGARYSVKVYRLAPIYDSTNVGSKKKYIMIYLAAPAPDEERIKRDCGSGRYRLYLNGKTSGTHKEAELAAVEIDILDPAFPPNLPVGDWLDEPKNRDWQWAKPLLEARQAKALQANTPPPAAPGVNMMDAMEMVGQLQDRAEERAKERMDSNRPQTWNPAEQLATVVTAAKDIAGALRATPENPIPSFISDQMTAMRAEIAAARARSDALMDKLLERASAPPPQQNSGMSAIKELIAGVKELLPSLKDLWPNADDAIAERITRSKMGPWQEFFQPVLPGIVNALAPILPGIVAGLAGGGRAAGPPAQFTPGLPTPARLNPAMAPPAQPQAQHVPDLDGMLLNALTNDRDGGEFADSLIMLFGQQGQLMYSQASSLGEQGLLTLIQGRPIWQQLGPLQAKVAQFVKEFIEYGQEPSETPEGTEPTSVDAEVVDLTGEPA
jgi:hypothetical protein